MSFLSLTTLQSGFNHSFLKQKAAGAQRGSVTCRRTHAQGRGAVWAGIHCFLEGSAVKESTCNAGDPGSISGSGGSNGEGRGYLLQSPGLENFMDCIVYGVTKSWTQLSDFHFHAFRTFSHLCQLPASSRPLLCHLKFQTLHTKDEIVILDKTFDPTGSQFGQVQSRGRGVGRWII